MFQYEDLAHYGLDGMGGVYGDPHHPHHPHHAAAAARSLQAVHLAATAAAAGPYPPHQYPQSTHSSSSMAPSSGEAVKRDKDAIYGYDEFTDTAEKQSGFIYQANMTPLNALTGIGNGVSSV